MTLAAAKTVATVALVVLLGSGEIEASESSAGEAGADEQGDLDVPAAAEAAGDAVDRGRRLAAPCVACHGDDGNSAVPSYPSIAGQNPRYLLQQMQLMRSGERPAPLMAGQLDAMTDRELADLAAYYAAQTGQAGQANADRLALGEAIYRGGLLAKGVPACSACHAPDGSGNALAGFPRLSGQQVDYVVDQLRAYREGLRTTDEAYSGMMRQTVANLNDGELAAVANYIHGLGSGRRR